MNQSINHLDIQISSISVLIRKEMTWKRSSAFLTIFKFLQCIVVIPTSGRIKIFKNWRKSWVFFVSFLLVKLSHSCTFNLLPAHMVPIYNIAHMYVKNMYFISLCTSKECIPYQCFYCYSHFPHVSMHLLNFHRYSFYQLVIFNFE